SKSGGKNCLRLRKSKRSSKSLGGVWRHMVMGESSNWKNNSPAAEIPIASTMQGKGLYLAKKWLSLFPIFQAREDQLTDRLERIGFRRKDRRGHSNLNIWILISCVYQDLFHETLRDPCSVFNLTVQQDDSQRPTVILSEIVSAANVLTQTGSHLGKCRSQSTLPINPKQGKRNKAGVSLRSGQFLPKEEEQYFLSEAIKLRLVTWFGQRNQYVVRVHSCA